MDKDKEYDFTIGEHDKGKKYAISRLGIKSKIGFDEWILIYWGVLYSYKSFDEISDTLNRIALALNNETTDDDKYFVLVVNIKSDFIKVASCETYKVTFSKNPPDYKMCPFSNHNS